MTNNTNIILDVRTKEEFEQGHASESINVPLSDLDAYIQTLSKDTPIVVVCESGGRAMMAVLFLQQRGFTQVTCGGSWRDII